MADNGKKTKDKRETLIYDEKSGKDEVVFSDSNNRANERIDVSLEVTLSGPHTFFSGFTMDISKGGLFIATHRVFPIGTEFLLKLAIAGNDLEILTEVVWVRNVNNYDISGEPPGMGLKFIDIDDKALEVISKFVLKKDPLLYDTEL
jgi:uncharacterized protein (TIGR02266 family)